MSISHWGFFPGFWVAVHPSYQSLHHYALGAGIAVWQPCEIETMGQWQ